MPDSVAWLTNRALFSDDTCLAATVEWMTIAEDDPLPRPPAVAFIHRQEGHLTRGSGLRFNKMPGGGRALVGQVAANTRFGVFGGEHA